MTKYLKNAKWIAMVMAFVIALDTSALVVQAKNKSKTYYYLSGMTAQKSDKDRPYGNIYKFRLKNNKLTIWGSFTRYNSEKNYDNLKNGKYLSYKKRTFTLSKKVKYYDRGMVGDQRLSREDFKRCLKFNGNGIDFVMVIKNNKIVKILFTS